MNLSELTRLADMLEEDAFDISDFSIEEINEITKDGFTAKDFKEKYLSFYDDIKTTPKDDW